MTVRGAILVLPTSGTTGPPKQVPLTQQNIEASIAAWTSVFKFQSTDVCFNIMPIWHGALISNVLTTHRAGGRVISITCPSAEVFREALAQYAPTWVPLPVKMAKQLLGDEIIVHPRHPLRFVRLSKASLKRSEILDLEKIFRCPVLQSYGMTEASSGPVACETVAERKYGSVGKPIHLQIKLINEEILIRGPSVMNGYLDGPPDVYAFEWINGEKWFNTRDHGYFDRDGYLYLNNQ